MRKADITVLKSKYLRIEKDGFRIPHPMRLNPNELCLYLDTACMICAAGLEAFFKIIGFKKDVILVEIANALEKVRPNWK